MCFKNLPIEFDAQGKPYLRAGVANPYAPTTSAPRGAPAQLTAENVEQLLRRNGYIKEPDFDPVTRVSGASASSPVRTTRPRWWGPRTRRSWRGRDPAKRSTPRSTASEPSAS